MKRCPNCGYERQLKDDEYKIIPTTECPKCGIIYDKWTSTKNIGDKSKEKENKIPQVKESKYSENKSLTNAALLIFSVLIVITLIVSLYSKWSVPSKAQQSKKTDQATHAGSVSGADLAINGTQTSTISPANQSASAVLDVPSQSLPQDLPSLYKTVAPSVVLISTDKSRGTGFFINNGYDVTNNHVIAGASQIKIKTSDNKEYVVRQIITKDATNDLAILSATDSQGAVRSLVISPIVPEVGEKIFVVSNPLDRYEKSLSEGIIAGIRESSSLKLFQFTAPISWK